MSNLYYLSHFGMKTSRIKKFGMIKKCHCVRNCYCPNLSNPKIGNTKSHWNKVGIDKLKGYDTPRTEYSALQGPNQNSFGHSVEVLGFWGFFYANIFLSSNLT